MLQTHHITYEPEWTVELKGWQHKAVTLMQRLNPTAENYANVINFQTAINHEVNRIRKELDTKGEE